MKITELIKELQQLELVDSNIEVVRIANKDELFKGILFVPYTGFTVLEDKLMFH